MPAFLFTFTHAYMRTTNFSLILIALKKMPLTKIETSTPAVYLHFLNSVCLCIETLRPPSICMVVYCLTLTHLHCSDAYGKTLSMLSSQKLNAFRMDTCIIHRV